MPQLIRIRWLAAPGLLLVSWWLARPGQPEVVFWWLLPLLILGSNLAARHAGRRWPAAWVAGTLIVLDSSLLTWWLWHSGGASNPFTLLYLTLIALAALVLGPTWTFVIAAFTSLQFGFLLLVRTSPGANHAGHLGHGGSEALDTHLQGMFLAFLLAAALTASFVSGLRRELDARELELARERGERSRAERLAALSTMIGSAAHELSTPVATLALAGEEIGRRLRSDDPELASELEPELEALREQSARCRKILDGLAESAGDPRGEAPHAVPLAEILAAARADLPEDLAARLLLPAVDPIEVVAPRRALVGALGALLRNAFDASAAPAAVVEVEVHEAARRIALVVLDRGHGIAAEHLERVGEPFFTTKSSGRGLGLGLFMARSLVHQLGGEVLLENRPGGGAAATLFLPRGQT